MIEVTDEMVEAFDAQTQFEGVDPTEIALGIVAVLAIVEREYEVHLESSRRGDEA